MKKLYFEELEKMEELGWFADFGEAASPWIFGGLTLAVALAVAT